MDPTIGTPSKDAKDKREDLTVIDGSLHEGGGQILRTTLTLSTLLQRPILIHSIRAKRPKPGLRPQHLQCVHLVRNMSHCSKAIEFRECPKLDDLRTVLGMFGEGRNMEARVGTTVLGFAPGDMQGGVYKADTQTAGSISLLIQVALPVLLFAGVPSEHGRESVLDLYGGTDVEHAPPIDYIRHILLPTLQKHCIPPNPITTFHFQTLRRGFYPAGNGHVQLRVRPLPPGTVLQAMDLTNRGEALGLQGRIVVSVPGGSQGKNGLHGLGEQIRADIMKAVDALFGTGKLPEVEGGVQVETVVHPRIRSPSVSVVLWIPTSTHLLIPSSTFTQPTSTLLNPSLIALECVQLLHSTFCTHPSTQAPCVDEYLQDQLIVFMALARGISRMLSRDPLSDHAKGVLYVVGQMLGAKVKTTKVVVEGSETGLVLVEVKGVGYVAR
ncbi:hypothetical protein HDV05_007289 [Chytridiales sp. JEL 0842]|nr:hypothetical protein HDV05_007289 [Chytridiales sp. JEL 0842]